MKAKHTAFFFLYLVSFQYVLGVVAAVNGSSDNNHILERKRRATGCRLTPSCQAKLETCFTNVRNDMPDEFELPNQRLEEYQLTQGTASGFRNFVWEPFQCTCDQDSVRITVRINFLRILLTFVMSLLDELLGGLLGSLGSALAKVLGNVVNLLVRILALRIEVEITILQRFIPGTKCILESYRVSKVTNITLLGLNLAPIAEILSPLLTPIVDLLLQTILNGKVKEAFKKEIEQVTILKTEVICITNPPPPPPPPPSGYY